MLGAKVIRAPKLDGRQSETGSKSETGAKMMSHNQPTSDFSAVGSKEWRRCRPNNRTHSSYHCSREAKTSGKIIKVGIDLLPFLSTH
uniref:Uncharacterized protein n=1 Tax=Romanomermis culicivorax TaxID=13658 RepID=A0A915IYP0_ROMCU